MNSVLQSSGMFQRQSTEDSQLTQVTLTWNSAKPQQNRGTLAPNDVLRNPCTREFGSYHIKTGLPTINRMCPVRVAEAGSQLGSPWSIVEPHKYAPNPCHHIPEAWRTFQKFTHIVCGAFLLLYQVFSSRVKRSIHLQVRTECMLDWPIWHWRARSTPVHLPNHSSTTQSVAANQESKV